MAGASTGKTALRERMRAHRSGLEPGHLATASAQICERLVALVGEGVDVAWFWPMLKRGEIDLRSLVHASAGRSWRLHLPYMEADGAEGFRHAGSGGALVPGPRGFLQPGADEPLTERLDWVIVPALAASPSGHRLGYGAGFYDRALARFCPPAESVVVALESQLMDVPVEAHDRPCDWVVTEARTQPAQTQPAPGGAQLSDDAGS